MSTASELRLTNANLEAMPEDGNRYEVIDGELYVSSAPGYLHQKIIFITNERPRKTLAGGRFHAAPEIVIEILSPGTSNERRNRHVKRSLYAVRGVEEYWLVDPENHTVELHRRNKAGELAFDKSALAEDELTSDLLPGFGIRIDALFV